MSKYLALFQFYHTVIIVGMLTLALSLSSNLIETFMDLLNYPPSTTVQLMLRFLPYLNCALMKPIVYLIYYHEIFPTRKQIFNQGSSPNSRTLSQAASEVRMRSRLATHESEMTTEEILNGIRELKRQSSMSSANQFGILRNPKSAIGRSKSFDSHLNTRLANQKLPQMASKHVKTKSVANPLYDTNPNQQESSVPTSSGHRSSRYVNFGNVNGWANPKPKSESQLLRPSSMYINLGALSKANRLSRCEPENATQTENPDGDNSTEVPEIPQRQEIPTIPGRDVSLYDLDKSAFAVDLHVYSDIKYHKELSVDSGCYSSPGTPNHLSSGRGVEPVGTPDIIAEIVESAA